MTQVSKTIACPLLLIGLALLTTSSIIAADRPAEFRPEMKRRLEALKERQSRLPLPAPTAEDIASGRRLVNNGRLRSTYLPESWQSQSTRPASAASQAPVSDRQRLSEMQRAPDYPFKTRLFWIVSRTNDCTYCLGHQELKLRSTGMQEDEIAALDCEWQKFPANEQAAFRFTRKLTFKPHQLTNDDIQELRSHFDDTQLTDLALTIAGYNSTNRWTASTGIPQDQSFGGEGHSVLDTPTSAAFEARRSQVAPLDYVPRPAWESGDIVRAQLAATKVRTPAITLPQLETARAVLAADTPGTNPPAWFIALSSTPSNALRVWKQRQGITRDGKLSPLLKARLAWIVARENRAWYSAGIAHERLLALGETADAVFELGTQDSSALSPESAAFAFARKLTAAPHLIGDDDVAQLRTLFSDHEVAEIIALVADCNSFDRWTEALQLPADVVSAPAITAAR